MCDWHDGALATELCNILSLRFRERGELSEGDPLGDAPRDFDTLAVNSLCYHATWARSSVEQYRYSNRYKDCLPSILHASEDADPVVLL
jgi:hypothetical protein